MVNTSVIRPLLPSELDEYFQKRFYSALKNNKALIPEGSPGFEIDPFDKNAIHIGCFEADKLLGCIRLVFPPGSNYFQTNEVILEKIQLLSSKGSSLLFPTTPLTLPSSSFLKENDRRILENHFSKLQSSGYKISEAGRLIKFSKEFSIQKIILCLSYVFALNLYYNIDYCFFNSTFKHALFYKRHFSCKRIYPNLIFETGAKEKKSLVVTDIKNSIIPQRDQVNKILSMLKKSGRVSSFLS